MLLELLATARGAGRVFTSVPYVGTGAVRTLATDVDATNGAAAILRELGNNKTPALYDTVRGATQRIQPATNEDVLSTLSFTGSTRVFTGTPYNTTSLNYALWNFRRRAGFFDAITFSGGAGATAHALAESPKLILVFRRTGSSGPKMLVWLPTDSYSVRDQIFTNNGGTPPFTVSSTTVTPASAVFPSGNTYVAYLFGTSSNNAVVSGYNGTVPGGTAGSHTEPIGFTPSWGLLWGPTNDAALTTYQMSVYDRRIAGTIPAGGFGPGWEGFYPSTIHLPLEVSGSDVIGSSIGSGLSALSACLDLGEYRFLFVR